MCVYMHATSKTYNKKKLLHNFIFQQNPPAISVAAYTQTEVWRENGHYIIIKHHLNIIYKIMLIKHVLHIFF